MLFRSQHTGFVRDYSDNKWKLFSNVVVEPTTTVTFDSNTYYDTIKIGGIDLSNGPIANASSISVTSLSLTSALTVPNGGTGATSFNSGQVVIGSGTNALQQLANVTSYTSQGSASAVPVITTDVYGRVTNITPTSIAIDTSQVTTGTLPIVRGGTNSSSYAQNGTLYYNGTSFLTAANVTAYSTQGGASYVPVITTDTLGRVTNISNTQIQLDTSNIISGTLGVVRGGTGAATFNVGQIVVGNGTGALQQIANVTTSVTGSLATNNTITSITTDAWGRLTAYTGAAISGLTVGQGGTGASTFTSSGVLYGNGTGALQATALAGSADQTWSNQILTVTNVGVPVWSSAMDGGTF